MGKRIHAIKIGDRFGRLVIRVAGAPNKWGHETWICDCDCGRETCTVPHRLARGKTRSCGCLARERTSEVKHKHGESFGSGSMTAEYSVWSKMRGRCNNPNLRDFARYGGRGIKVCRRWRDYRNFLADMGRRPSSKHWLDRIDNSRGYSPSNCRWATIKEQQRNRRDTKRVRFNGETKSLAEWADVIRVPYKTLWARLKAGWTVARAFNPSRRSFRPHVSPRRRSCCAESVVSSSA